LRAGGYCTQRKRSGTQENRGFQAFPYAFQGSNRLLDGTLAEVRWHMNSNDSLPKGRKLFRLPMISVGIFCAIFQLANARGLRADFGQSLAYAAAIQTSDNMPRVENAQAETRAVSGTLEATLRGILAQAEKPEWVGYSVDDISGDRSMCCGNWSDGAGCGTC